MTITACTRSEAYRYRLASHPEYCFRVGRSETRQVIWGMSQAGCLIAEFDLQGNLLGHELLQLQQMTPDWHQHSLESLMNIATLKTQSKFEIREDAVIEIGRFWLPRIGVGIEDLSDTLKEYVVTPDHFSEEERNEYSHILSEWLTSGRYVFHWGQDFYVDAKGSVETS